MISQLMQRNGRYRPQNCEWRVSIYGRRADEWDKLAKWIINHKLYSHNVRWLVQVPRLYDVYKLNGSIDTFEDIVRSRRPIRLASFRSDVMVSSKLRRLQAVVRGYERPFDTP